MKKELVIIVPLITVIVIVAFYEEVRRAIVLLTYTIVVLMVIGCLLVLVYLLWLLIERVRVLRARRIEAEKRAHVLTVTAGNQVFIRDTDHRATWRLLHLEARTVVNNQTHDPTDLEIQQWQFFNQPRTAANSSVAYLPSPTSPDVLHVLDSAQCALIVGPRDSGKTTLLQHVIGRRLGRSYIVVLDPHSHPSRWPPMCQVVGTERDFPKIEAALRGLLALMNKRYRDIGKGLVREGEHKQVTVVIDEWRAIVHQLGKPAAEIIKTLLAESRKTNIDVFVGTHSERVKALGIEGEGDLKEGFVMVRLTVNKLTGERSATVDFGDGELPAILPGSYRSHGASLLPSGSEIISVELKPTEQEQKILDLYRAGNSLRSISQAVFEGRVGQFYNQKIQAVLEKYGEK